MRLSLNQKLYGTAQSPQILKQINVGPLSLSLDGGNIRYLRFQGVEILRAVSFLVRDTKWGTYTPELMGLRIARNANMFSLSYDAICTGEEGRFQYHAKIEGHATGCLKFSSKGSSTKDFPTNRVGFVVLHPLEGFVGKKVVLKHTDGQKSKVEMPKEIAANQPAFDLRAITHSPIPDLKVHVEMLGDAYEMEDQRNWCDASFKTYVRPLSKPRPFVIPALEIVEQSITIDVSGNVKTASSQKKKIDPTIRVSKARFPTLSLGLDPQEIAATQQNSANLLKLRVDQVVVRIDTRTLSAENMHEMASCLAALQARAHFEIVIPGINPAEELSEFEAALKLHNVDLGSVTVSPYRDLMTRPSHQLPTGEASAPHIAQIARARFPHARIGGGTFAFFTEFNRNPPPIDDVDFVTHATCGIVHAADDISVMETLQSLDDMVSTVRKLAPRKPYHISPSAIGMRHNPYGASTAANPLRQRLTLARFDPRQSGLFAASWAVGYLATMVRNKVDMVGLAHGVGDFGVIEESGALRPIFHVLRGAALGAGKLALAVPSLSKLIAVFGYQDNASQVLWVANLSAQPQTFTVERRARISELNAKTFAKAARHASFMDTVTSTAKSITLPAYAVARLVL